MVDEYLRYDNSVIPKFNHTNLMVWVFQLFFDYMVCGGGYSPYTAVLHLACVRGMVWVCIYHHTGMYPSMASYREEGRRGIHSKPTYLHHRLYIRILQYRLYIFI